MPISGQQSSWLSAQDFDGYRAHSVTVQVPNRDTFADIVLLENSVIDQEWHAAKCGITQIVSASGVENWDIDLPDTYTPVAFRRNVTSITFSVVVFDGRAAARWMLFFWS
jgi:hypothetical protein